MIMAAEMNKKYLANLKAFEDSVALKSEGKPLFIPLSFHFFPAKFCGVSNAAVMQDTELRFKCLKEVIYKYDFPMAPGDGLYWGSWPWNTLKNKQWLKPGDELGEDQPFQFHEQENLKADEYDAFLNDPGDFTFRKILPRVSGLLEPLGMLPPLHNYLYYPMYAAPFFSLPNFVEMLDGLKLLGQQWVEYNFHFENYSQELTAAGYPPLYGGVGFAPFDTFSVFLRGLKGSFLDMIRAPEKVLATIEFLTDRGISMLKAQAEIFNNPRVVIFAYRGAEQFISKKHFEKFYWPSLRQTVIELVESGITPIIYIESDISSRLPYFLDLPKGKVPIHVEKVDRHEARKILGDNNCIWGDIPAPMLTLGTPNDVKENVRELIDIFGDTNGLIIDGAVEIPDETKPENIDAVFEAIEKYS